MVHRTIVAVVAADEPETAARIPQPITLTCISRPGIRVIHGESPLNMSSARRVRNRISPIQMNSGSAVSDHDQDCPQLVVAMIEPAGADENAAMPMTPTANSDRATQKPPAKMTIRASPRMVPSHPASMAQVPVRSEEHTLNSSH